VSQGFEDSLVVVGFLGRLHPDKGLATLALAMENLQVGEIAVKLVVKGYSDGLSVDFLEESLLRKVDAVVDVGIGNARDFYHSIDIFCMPSYREGLSTVNLEAAACGLPVVTTTATGCIDSLLRGESGLAVPPRDPEALASAISKLVTDPNLRVSMGQAGCNFVRANFERKIVWKRNLAFFDSLIG
jgi:glycosyltransferase involved in cell wall biosynthesis